jgi:hypothetical protein
MDLLAVGVASVALVATIFLSLVGFLISSKFSGVEGRIKAVEDELRDDRSELIGLRAISSIILRFVNDTYALADVERRQIEDIAEAWNATNPEKKIDIELFNNSLEKIMGHFPRVALYAKLLAPGTDEIADTLDDIVAKYPDMDTLYYLEALGRVMDSEDQAAVDVRVQMLRKKLIPYYDRRLWIT